MSRFPCGPFAKIYDEQELTHRTVYFEGGSREVP